MRLRNIYMVIRVVAYLLSLSGVFLFLRHRQDADTRLASIGTSLLMAGCLCFFISYALRIWMSIHRKNARAEHFRTTLRDPDPLEPPESPASSAGAEKPDSPSSPPLPPSDSSTPQP